MVSRIPVWGWIGAWLLALSAGNINVVGILGTQQHALTHLTGTTSLLAISASKTDWATAIHYGYVIGAFVLGASLSGVLVQDISFQMGRRYSITLLIVGLLLVSSAQLFRLGSDYGIYLAASACGLQNAMVTTFSSATIRTTHLSGMFTDLGIYLGHAIRGLPVDQARLRLSATIISGFLIGGIAGGFLYPILRHNTLLLSAVVSFLCSLLLRTKWTS